MQQNQNKKFNSVKLKKLLAFIRASDWDEIAEFIAAGIRRQKEISRGKNNLLNQPTKKQAPHLVLSKEM